MDTDSIQLLLVLVILLLLSAYFSASETAFSSLNRIRIKHLAETGHKRAKLVWKLSENYDKLLSTILIGNNIVNIASASLATALFVKWFGDLGVTLSTVIMTVLVLIFGEISPKSLAKESPDSFALFSAPILNALIVLLTPVNFLFVQWKKLLSKLFKTRESRPITEDELITLVEEAEQEGGIGGEEGELIRSAIEFGDLTAEDIFTPRVDVEGIPQDADSEEIARVFAQTGFSRLPVYEGTIDRIVGVIHQKDFYNRVYHRAAPLSSIVQPAVFVPGTMKISDLLHLLQQRKAHMAVLADEYGGTVGIVTMEDILEELVGEIWDEHDEVVTTFEKLGDNCYKVVCSADLDEMFDYFRLTGTSDASSVSGWVMEQLDKVPAEGDSFRYENLCVTVHKTDGHRVLEILVDVQPPETEPEETGRKAEKSNG